MKKMAADLLHSRRSVRKFKNEVIDENTLDKILQTAIRAPTGGNLQSYAILVTKDSERRRLLSEIHFSMDMVKQAPTVLTFCADVTRNSQWATIGSADLGLFNMFGFYLGFVDAIAAAQNVVFAAEEMGLGTCYSGATFQRVLSLLDFFKCPKGVIPVASLVIGHPNESPVQRSRLPLSAVVMEETYKSRGHDELVDLYREKEQADWEHYLSNFEDSGAVVREGPQNLAQIYSQLKYRPEDNKIFSHNYQTALIRQGFLAKEMSQK